LSRLVNLGLFWPEYGRIPAFLQGRGGCCEKGAGATLLDKIRIEKDLKTKEEITAALKQSYEVIINAVKNTKDAALATKVEFPFPGEFTNMSSILIALSHSNEHLGQLIAYSRMNGITPPWSETK